VYIQNRFAGLSNPNSIGVVMALNGAMGLWMAEYFSSRSQSLRWVVIVLFLCSVIGLYLTGSRSSALGFLGGAAIWAWATRRSTLIVLVAVLGTAFFLTTDPAPVSPSMSGSSSYRIQDPQMTQFRLDEPLKTREEVWNESYESWKERLWFGYGYGLTGKTFTLRSLTSAVGAVRDGSGYLGLLESIGAVGAASLLFVYVIVLRYVWQGVRLWRQGYRHLEVWLLLMAGTVFVALIINGGGEPWMIGPGSFMHTFLWFSVAGVLAARSLFFTNVLDSPSPAASKTAQASS
jgi:O-antigen ligase